MKEKSEVLALLKRWLAMVERQLEVKLQALECFKGGEFTPRDMKAFPSDRGSVSCPSVPHNPHQNGVAERLNRTFCDFVRSMRDDFRLSRTFWV